MIGIQCCCFRSHICHVRGRQLNPQSNPFLFPITNSLTHSLSLKHLEPGCAVTYRKERQRHPHSDRDCCPLAETAFPQELPSKNTWREQKLAIHLFTCSFIFTLVLSLLIFLLIAITCSLHVFKLQSGFLSFFPPQLQEEWPNQGKLVIIYLWD